jgi:hypothetical protein
MVLGHGDNISSRRKWCIPTCEIVVLQHHEAAAESVGAVRCKDAEYQSVWMNLGGGAIQKPAGVGQIPRNTNFDRVLLRRVWRKYLD